MDQPTIEQIVNEWASITIEEWQKKLKKFGVGVSGKLAASFQKSIYKNGDSVSAVELRFQYYGRYVDMGVSRSRPIGNPILETVNERRGRLGLNIKAGPKRWYSKTKTHEVYRLRELLAKYYKIETVGVMESGLPGSLKIEM
jgi:hypothetical protein